MGHRALGVAGLCALAWVAGYIPGLLGEGLGSFVRRQSEAYVLIAFVVGFWAWVASDGHPSSRGAETARFSARSVAQYSLWFLGLLAALVLFGGSSVPNALVTLKEAVVTIVVVSAYLMWSRGIGPDREWWRSGAPVYPWSKRRFYYVAVFVLIAIVYVPGLGRVVGESTLTWLLENNEAYAAIILVPLYFDVPARSRKALIKVGWYGVLVATALAIQWDGFPAFFMPVLVALREMTEAFIAAIAISVFFDVIARDKTRAATGESSPTGRPVFLA